MTSQLFTMVARCAVALLVVAVSYAIGGAVMAIALGAGVSVAVFAGSKR